LASSLALGVQASQREALLGDKIACAIS